MDNKKDSQIVDFVDKLKTQKELREYATAQFVTLLQANKRIEALEKENASLRSQLVDNQTTTLPRSSEELTCQLEIAKIHQRALVQELPMEDVKKLEILVKTLYAAKSKSMEEMEASYKNVDTGNEADLLKLASLPEDSSSGGN